MDRLAGYNYYLDNGIQHFKYVASQTQNSLTFFKLRRFFETWHEFFAQPAAAKLKIKATISCFLQTCAHKPRWRTREHELHVLNLKYARAKQEKYDNMSLIDNYQKNVFK